MYSRANVFIFMFFNVLVFILQNNILNASPSILFLDGKTYPEVEDCKDEIPFADWNNCTNFYLCIVDSDGDWNLLSFHCFGHYNNYTKACVDGPCSEMKIPPEYARPATPSAQATSTPPVSSPQVTPPPATPPTAPTTTEEPPSPSTTLGTLTPVVSEVPTLPKVENEETTPPTSSATTEIPASVGPLTTLETTTLAVPTKPKKPKVKPVKPILTNPPFPCTEEGIFPAPTNCAAYHRCIQLKGKLFPVVHKCPPNTHFDITQKLCISGGC